MVVWLTGLSGAGKTSVAKKLQRVIPRSVVLDGDDMRLHFKAGFDDVGRCDNIMRLAHFAAILERQNYVPIIACVSPKREWRDNGRKLFKESIVIYLKGGTKWEGSEYEPPTEDELL